LDCVARAIVDRFAFGKAVGIIRVRARAEDEGVKAVRRMDVEITEEGNFGLDQGNVACGNYRYGGRRRDGFGRLFRLAS